MIMYRIRVGNFLISGEYTEVEADRMIIRIKQYFKNEIVKIPVKEAAKS